MVKIVLQMLNQNGLMIMNSLLYGLVFIEPHKILLLQRVRSTFQFSLGNGYINFNCLEHVKINQRIELPK